MRQRREMYSASACCSRSCIASTAPGSAVPPVTAEGSAAAGSEMSSGSVVLSRWRSDGMSRKPHTAARPHSAKAVFATEYRRDRFTVTSFILVPPCSLGLPVTGMDSIGPKCEKVHLRCRRGAGATAPHQISLLLQIIGLCRYLQTLRLFRHDFLTFGGARAPAGRMAARFQRVRREASRTGLSLQSWAA